MFTKKLERMYQPPSNLDKYDNEAYTKNPLLKFRLSDVHERRHYQFLKESAAVEKIKIARKPLRAEPEMRLLPESHYVDNLRREVRKIIVPKMLKRTEAKILSYAPDRLKNKYPELVANYMKEVHSEFDRLMKIYSMKNILIHPEFSDEDPEQFNLPRKDFHFRYPGRTENYPNFLEKRRKVAKKLMIPYLPIRTCLSLAELEFPRLIVDLDPIDAGQNFVALLGLGGREVFTNRQIIKYVNTRQGNLLTFLRWTWYPKLITILRKQFRRRLVPHGLWKRGFHTIEALINRQLNNLKQRTFAELLRVCKSARLIPVLKVQLVCTNYDDIETIDIDPSYESIVDMFVKIVIEFSELGIGMEPLDPQIDPNMANFEDEFLHIEMSEIFINEFIEELKNALLHTYQPIHEYINGYQEKYYGLYGQIVREDLDNFLSKPREFEEYFEKIDWYYEYIDMLRSEPANDYFEMAIIQNTPAIKRLREIADGLIARITAEIVREHIKAEEKICAEFESIKKKALEIPKTTEELLEAGEYMIYVKKEKIFEVRDRIQYCLQVGTNLIELTEMDQYHFDLTITTINWLHEINEICDYNASQQEYYKSLFEEHLQDVVRKLNDDILELIPKMSIIDDMSEPEKFRNSYIILKNFIDQLKTFDDYVKWINKEEKLFKVPQTLYPTLEVLKNFVYPFASLMKACIDWLRYLNVWMDGPFEYLVPKFVEETTDYYLKEFQKNQKYYRVKIKQDLIENPVCKFRGQTEDSARCKKNLAQNPGNMYIWVFVCLRLNSISLN